MKWRLFAAGLAFVLGGVGCSKKPEPAAAPAPLVVGMELAYPPFEMTDAAGKPAGISVELAEALAAHLGRPLRVENIPFDGLIPALKTGRIDLILSSMTATPERAQSIDFSHHYLRTGLALLVAKDSPVGGYRDLAQPGRRVAVKLGTTGELFARDRIPEAEVHVLKEESACVLEVVQGKVDAFIYDQMSVFRHWSRNKETTRALLEAFQKEDWAIGIRKGDDAMRESVNAFLATFRADGGFDQLARKHLPEMKQAFDELGHDFVF